MLKQSFKSFIEAINFSILLYTERKTEDNKLVRYFCFAKTISQNAPLFLYLLTMRRFTMNERSHACGLISYLNVCYTCSRLFCWVFFSLFKASANCSKNKNHSEDLDIQTSTSASKQICVIRDFKARGLVSKVLTCFTLCVCMCVCAYQILYILILYIQLFSTK